MTEKEFKELEEVIRKKHIEDLEELIEYLRKKLVEKEKPSE